MRRSLFLRVWGGYVLVSALAVLLFAGYTLRLVRGSSFDALTRGLESTALTARVAVAPLVAGDGRTTWSGWCARWAGEERSG